MSYIHDSGLSTSAHPPAEAVPAERAISALHLAEYEDPLVTAGEAIAAELPGCLHTDPGAPLHAAAIRAGINPDDAQRALAAYIGLLSSILRPAYTFDSTDLAVVTA